jgi:hypothetical protein
MKKILKEKVQRIAQNPVAQKTLVSMKPQKTILGFLGVVIFFILPEVIAFFYASQITTYANTQLLLVNSIEMQYYYKALVMTFEDGVSYLNLFVGFALLVWLFF